MDFDYDEFEKYGEEDYEDEEDEDLDEYIEDEEEEGLLLFLIIFNFFLGF